MGDKRYYSNLSRIQVLFFFLFENNSKKNLTLLILYVNNKMGAGCVTAIIPCSLESGCAVASSAIAIGSKIYQINKLRKRANSVQNKILLPPIIRKKRLRNNTE
jgi:hypothetical protein